MVFSVNFFWSLSFNICHMNTIAGNVSYEKNPPSSVFFKTIKLVKIYITNKERYLFFGTIFFKFIKVIMHKIKETIIKINWMNKISLGINLEKGYPVSEFSK